MHSPNLFHLGFRPLLSKLLVLLADTDMEAESSPALSVNLFISSVIFFPSDIVLSARSLAVVDMVGDENSLCATTAELDLLATTCCCCCAGAYK
jgi:hypothetical protein